MRSFQLSLFAIPLLALIPRLEVGRAPTPRELRSQDKEQHLAADWIEVMTHELPDGLVRPAPGAGAMGTSAFPVQFGKVSGTLLLDRRHGDQVSIFLGWSPPEKHAEDAHEDLRVRFRDVEGVEHVTDRYAGAAYGAQFVSPGDVDITTLREFSLLVRSKARWLKGK